MLGRPTTGQVLSFVLYYAVARRLPWSIEPGGRLARRIRGTLCRHLFKRCGRDVNVEQGAWFGSGRELSVGDRSAIGKDALIMGAAVIGDDVMMGPRVIVLSTNHVTEDLSRPMNSQGLSDDDPVVIEDDVWVGAGAVLLPGRRIGRGSVVAAGCVVTKDVPPFAVVGGNPMRVLKDRREVRK